MAVDLAALAGTDTLVLERGGLGGVQGASLTTIREIRTLLRVRCPDKPMKSLIVNADDFGLTEGVNRAIIDGHRNGIITSTTLMANGMAFDSAVAAGLAAPALGIGVHLNLTQGRPVSSASRVPSIVTPRGSFYPGPGILATASPDTQSQTPRH